MNLVFWPDNLPLTVDYPGGRYLYGASLASNDENNILFAPQHAPRVHCIKVLATGSLLRKMATILQKSFPVLTHLDLHGISTILRSLTLKVYKSFSRDSWVDLPRAYNISA